MKLGKVVGEPTAGWIIFTGAQPLIDGSAVRVPEWRIQDLRGQTMEMHPRPVDVEVARPLGETETGSDAQLERAVKEWGFRAAKLMPTLHAVNLVGQVAHAAMRKARELGIPVTIHSAGSPAHPLEIGVLAEAFPDVPVIMDHMGYRNHVGAAIAAAKRAPNLYLMTTAVMEPHCIQDAVREIGAHRVVFGSNGPAVRPSTQILVIKQAELAPADERKVLGENAARLLRL